MCLYYIENMSLPEFLSVQPLSKPYNAVLYTHSSDPTVHNSERSRFEISRSGILSPNGMLEFNYIPSALGGAGRFCAFPPNIGAASCVSKVVLSTNSGRIILSNDFFPQKQVVECGFRTAEYSRYVSRYLDMSNNCFGLYKLPASIILLAVLTASKTFSFFMRTSFISGAGF